MAITKIIAIRDRLDKRVNYAVNGEKTTLDTGITYAANPEKTEQLFFTSAINCESCETAFAEMQTTKRRFGKLGGVVGYHFIQSFAPGEVTPEQAHRIGVEFARRLFGERYEVVVGTHLDKVHLHNHVVVNSVSFVDGKKYHSSPGSYYFEVRSTSDILCRENDLSTITPQGKGKHYAEWKAENTGKPTIRSIIRGDIDRFIGEAYTYETFLMLLRQEGYVVRNAPSRKYVTVLPPGGKRAIRLDSLGEGYTEQDIRRRLAAQREGSTLATHKCDESKKPLVPADGVILPTTTVTFTEGESVFDVLQRLCRENKIHMESSWTPMYNSAYVEGINNLYEFDVGSLSGWMYSVNGWFPNYGCSRYALQNGDVVNWVYTCDLGYDVGGGYSTGS